MCAMSRTAAAVGGWFFFRGMGGDAAVCPRWKGCQMREGNERGLGLGLGLGTEDGGQRKITECCVEF